MLAAQAQPTGGQETEEVRTPGPLVHRTTDRTNYLATTRGSGHVSNGIEIEFGVRVYVIRWHGIETIQPGISLAAHKHPFDFQTSLSPSEAREIARALEQAAFEFEVTEREAQYAADREHDEVHA